MALVSMVDRRVDWHRARQFHHGIKGNAEVVFMLVLWKPALGLSHAWAQAVRCVHGKAEWGCDRMDVKT